MWMNVFTNMNLYIIHEYVNVNECVYKYESVYYSWICKCEYKYESVYHSWICKCEYKYESVYHSWICKYEYKYESVYYSWICKCDYKYESVYYSWMSKCESTRSFKLVFDYKIKEFGSFSFVPWNNITKFCCEIRGKISEERILFEDLQAGRRCFYKQKGIFDNFYFLKFIKWPSF